MTVALVDEVELADGHHIRGFTLSIFEWLLNV
jgi:hypothetical protein